MLITIEIGEMSHLMISAKKALVLVRSIMLEAFGSNRRVGGDSAEELWVMVAGFKS